MTEKNLGGRKKGYKVSEATKAKLRLAWKRRNEAKVLVTAPVSRRLPTTTNGNGTARSVWVPVTNVTIKEKTALLLVSDRKEAIEIVTRLLQFLA